MSRSSTVSDLDTCTPNGVHLPQLHLVNQSGGREGHRELGPLGDLLDHHPEASNNTNIIAYHRTCHRCCSCTLTPSVMHAYHPNFLITTTAHSSLSAYALPTPHPTSRSMLDLLCAYSPLSVHPFHPSQQDVSYGRARDELTQGRILLNHTSVVSAKLAFLLQGFSCFLDWTLAAHQVYSIDDLRSELRDLAKHTHPSRCKTSTSVCSLLEQQITNSTKLDIKAYDRSPSRRLVHCTTPPIH